MFLNFYLAIWLDYAKHCFVSFGFCAGGFSGGPYQCGKDMRGLGSIPGSGSPPGRGHGNPLSCSSLENPMDRGAWWASGVWWATVHRVAESSMTEVTEHTHTHTHTHTHILCCSPNGRVRQVTLLSPLYR